MSRILVAVVEYDHYEVFDRLLQLVDWANISMIIRAVEVPGRQRYAERLFLDPRWSPRTSTLIWAVREAPEHLAVLIPRLPEAINLTKIGPELLRWALIRSRLETARILLAHGVHFSSQTCDLLLQVARAPVSNWLFYHVPEKELHQLPERVARQERWRRRRISASLGAVLPPDLVRYALHAA